jgi:carbon monoxide dehydrogenase subunit G
MHLNNSFDVQAPIDEVYATLLDVERVATAVPGASVIESKGEDAYVVGIRIRVGPITVQYRGDVQIVEKDPAAHRAVMRVTAKEVRGQGTADADATLTLSETGGKTHGDIDVEVQIRGKIASMGQGAIQDVSNKIVGTFAQNLGRMLEGGGNGTPPAPASQTGSATVSAPAGAPGSSGAPAATAAIQETATQSAANGGSATATAQGPTHAGTGGDQTAAPPQSDTGSAQTAAQATKDYGADQPAGYVTQDDAGQGGGDDDDALNAFDLIGTVVAGRMREPKVAGGALLLVALLAFLLGRATGR